MRKAIALLLCAVLIAGFFSGCATGRIIRMDIGGPVENLDPQFTTDSTARMILANLFEGLVIKRSDGELRSGAAEHWEISPDGLTYTFTLREDARWESGSPVTARHFVFAMERLFHPDAPSPFADDYAVIEGAEEILAGKASLESLGVSAPDERTVVFRLRRPSAVFLELLCATPALPCHEETFEESRGRYGMEITYVYANGPFMLDRWDNTRYLYLTPNPYYRGDFTALPDRVTLYIGRENPMAQFLDGKSDLVLLSAGEVDRVKGANAELLPINRTMWCIVFNGKNDVYRNALLRQALALTLDRGSYAPLLEENYTVSGVLVPSDMMAGGQIYREFAGDDIPLSFDPDRGRELYQLALGTLEIGILPQTTLYLPESGGHADYMGMIQQGWQKHLDVHLVLEQNTNDKLEERLHTGDFRMMLMPYTPATENPGILLGAFRSVSSQNYIGYENLLFDQYLSGAEDAATSEDALAYYKAAEELLLRDACVIPVYFETNYLAFAKGVSGVDVSAFGGQILFADAVKS